MGQIGSLPFQLCCARLTCLSACWLLSNASTLPIRNIYYIHLLEKKSRWFKTDLYLFHFLIGKYHWLDFFVLVSVFPPVLPHYRSGPTHDHFIYVCDKSFVLSRNAWNVLRVHYWKCSFVALSWNQTGHVYHSFTVCVFSCLSRA